jgi:hypothetical protein
LVFLLSLYNGRAACITDVFQKCTKCCSCSSYAVTNKFTTESYSNRPAS